MSNLESELPYDVKDEEILSRFIYQTPFNNSNQLSKNFFPSGTEPETSVYRSSTLSTEATIRIGKQARPEKTLYGIAKVQALDVRYSNLSVIANEPPLYHAVIRGWNNGESQHQQKAEWKRICLLIAEKAEFIRANA